MGTKRGGVDVARPSHSTTSSSIPQFPFGLGPNAPPSIWSTSLDQGSPSFNSPLLGPRSDANVGQIFPSPKLQHAWSPQFESTRMGRQLAAHLSPQFQSSQSLSAVSPGHRESMPLGTPQHVPQPNFGPSYNLTSPMTPLTEHRQLQWQKPYITPPVDPAIVSVVSASQPTTHQEHASYQGFSDGLSQQYVRPGQHQNASSRLWGVHG